MYTSFEQSWTTQQEERQHSGYATGNATKDWCSDTSRVLRMSSLQYSILCWAWECVELYFCSARVPACFTHLYRIKWQSY